MPFVEADDCSWDDLFFQRFTDLLNSSIDDSADLSLQKRAYILILLTALECVMPILQTEPSGFQKTVVQFLFRIIGLTQPTELAAVASSSSVESTLQEAQDAYLRHQNSIPRCAPLLLSLSYTLTHSPVLLDVSVSFPPKSLPSFVYSYVFSPFRIVETPSHAILVESAGQLLSLLSVTRPETAFPNALRLVAILMNSLSSSLLLSTPSNFYDRFLSVVRRLKKKGVTSDTITEDMQEVSFVSFFHQDPCSFVSGFAKYFQGRYQPAVLAALHPKCCPFYPFLVLA